MFLSRGRPNPGRQRLTELQAAYAAAMQVMGFTRADLAYVLGMTEASVRQKGILRRASTWDSEVLDTG